jgi:uroporphyrinogen-III synthase|nr:uroporphyrinogen-III synthase [uncultured Caldimonas sp.]
MRVLVTRPAAQAGPWVEQLKHHGIDAHALPLIGIAPARDQDAVRAAWRQLHELGAVVFVSPNAVEQFFSLRPPGLAWPAGLLAATPGPGTDAVLEQSGVPASQRVQPDAASAQFDSVSLWEQLQDRPWSGVRVLIVRGDGGRDWLADRLREAGAEVRFLCAYQRCAPTLTAGEQALLREAVSDPSRHLWFFSSSESIDHLEGIVAASGSAVEWSQGRALATHPRIAERARRLGFVEVVECRPSMEAVVSAIERSIQSSAP